MAEPGVRVRGVVDDVLGILAGVPDDAWDVPADGLDWSCRETMAHLADTLGFYALQLAGERPPQAGYVALQDPAPWTPGGHEILFWPRPDRGTAGIVECLDATAGLLRAVLATAGARIGYHPFGNADASGFEAMALTETMLHSHEVLTAQGLEFVPSDGACAWTLDRVFPHAQRTGEPWRDLLVATGRTPETRGARWRWYSAPRG
ncbi:DinB family protein [Zafaria sp. Z1313]|uniref:DinB family protein n=1 Tax=unclassified Zafaria TaxID=2828765 RepID=UPI002E775356|nr:DinB family protein [Zafaria sp. J156]MEE1619861.1 DinB family protein [Zafaria sp. J156]